MSMPQPDEDSIHRRLVETNLGFVYKLARRYVGMGLSFEDLVGEGNVGLILAARHYDPSRGTKFTTYAVWWIRKLILKALADQTSGIRLPERVRVRIRFVLETERRIASGRNGDGTREELARHLNTSSRQIERILKLSRREVSFDQQAHADGGGTIHETLADARTPDPEAALLGREARARVRRALGRLSERDRRVLTYRFGLEDRPSQSLREVGQNLGVSREAIRLIEKRAKRKLRLILDGRPGPTSRGPLRRPCPTACAGRDGARPAPRT
jgi:RNA polymerase sigma factor (sigma-70 family)